MSLSHPFRLTAAGSAATVAQGTPAHAAQLAGHVVSVTPGERGLAPLFGLTPQAGGLVDPGAVVAAITTCAPDLRVLGVTVTDALDGQVDIGLSVDFDEGDD